MKEGAVAGTMNDSRDGGGHVAEVVVVGAEVAGAWSSGSGKEDGHPSPPHTSAAPTVS